MVFVGIVAHLGDPGDRPNPVDGIRPGEHKIRPYGTAGLTGQGRTGVGRDESRPYNFSFERLVQDRWLVPFGVCR